MPEELLRQFGVGFFPESHHLIHAWPPASSFILLTHTHTHMARARARARAPVELNDDAGGQAVNEVVRFLEKPNPELAEQFLRHGHFRWNTGMFVWPLAAILAALQHHTPQLAGFVEALHAGTDFAATVAERFPSLPKISIDYAVMEKAQRVLVVEAGFDWDDAGSWTAAARHLRQDAGENASNAEHLTTQNAAGNIVYTTRPGQVALLGVRDLIVVQTDDALLVAHRSEAEKIKQLVGKMPPEFQ